MDRALREVWNVRLTPEVLAGELARIARDTRRPDLLAELIEALNHDPVLLGECPARPLITERRFHLLYQHDADIHSPTRSVAESGRQALVQGARSAEARLQPLFTDDERSNDEGWLPPTRFNAVTARWFRECRNYNRPFPRIPAVSEPSPAGV